MIYIEKHVSDEVKNMLLKKSKSAEWIAIASDDTDNLRYQFDSLDKDKIRRDMLAEQHYLCAYCMKRIVNDGSHTTIEHIVPLSKSKNKVLDYNNFVCVCRGGADVESKNKKVLCCDGSKSNDEILINPLNSEQMSHIYYSRNGFVEYDTNYDKDGKFFEEINYILCLNGKRDKKNNDKFIDDTSTRLVKGRKDAYEKYTVILKTLAKNKKLNASQIQNLIFKMKNQKYYDEYAGVIFYFLERKYRQLINCK